MLRADCEDYTPTQLAQHTVPPADDALGRKRSGNVLVVEVVVISGEKVFQPYSVSM